MVGGGGRLTSAAGGGQLNFLPVRVPVLSVEVLELLAVVRVTVSGDPGFLTIVATERSLRSHSVRDSAAHQRAMHLFES